MDAIFHRISVRKYQQRPMKPEKLRRILKAAIAAPSAGNQHQRAFYVVTNRETIKALAAYAPIDL